MKFCVSFKSMPDFSIPKVYEVDTPSEAAVAERLYIFNECFHHDDALEYLLDCINDNNPCRDELIVCGQDGSSWVVTTESWPVFDLKKPLNERIRWTCEVTSCAKSEARFRWHEFSAQEMSEWGEVDEPYEGVHHLCESDPCAWCKELDEAVP